MTLSVSEDLSIIEPEARNVKRSTFQEDATFILNNVWFSGQYDLWANNEEAGLKKSVQSDPKNHDRECEVFQNSAQRNVVFHGFRVVLPPQRLLRPRLPPYHLVAIFLADENRLVGQ